MAASRRKKPVADTAALSVRLHDAGLRTTAARVAVLGLLEQAPRALSHADIEGELAHLRLDRVTLYRTLDSFVEAALAAKSIGIDRVTRFVTVQAGEHQSHAHFQCDDCGRLYCLSARVPRTAALPEGFEMASAQLTIHGHCADCSEPATAKR